MLLQGHGRKIGECLDGREVFLSKGTGTFESIHVDSAIECFIADDGDTHR